MEIVQIVLPITAIAMVVGIMGMDINGAVNVTGTVGELAKPTEINNHYGRRKCHGKEER